MLLLLLLLLEGETSAHEAAEGEVGSVFLFFCLVWVGGGGERVREEVDEEESRWHVDATPPLAVLLLLLLNAPPLLRSLHCKKTEARFFLLFLSSARQE